MPESGKENQDQSPKTQWTKPSGGVIEIYSNYLTLQWTLDDVRMRFAQLINDPDNPSPGKIFDAVAQERAAITLTWRNAKHLRDSLNDLLASYESVNGEIPLD